MKMSLALKRKHHFIATHKRIYRKTLRFINLLKEVDEYLKANGF